MTSENILPMLEACTACGEANYKHTKVQFENCSLVWTVKIHALEFKMKERKFSE